MAEERERWFRIYDPPDPRRPLTRAMEEKIREVAAEMDYRDLRGFWRHMQMREWDYYDILRMAYQ